MKKETSKGEAERPKEKSGRRGDRLTERGSGFTYDEAKQRTDRSVPLSEDNADSDLVKLPDLGKPNRP